MIETPKTRKAYVIKGSFLKGIELFEWSERITLSKRKSILVKNHLNSDLKEQIEKGCEISLKYLRSSEDTPWKDWVFDVESMTEEEHYLFYLYRYKNQLPFYVEEIDII